MNRLLIDTKVAILLLFGARDSISPRAVEALEDEANSIAISAVSFWEIAIKRSLGKLTVEDRWAQELTKLDFEPLPATAEHAERVEHLPWHHRDPFDRLLVAQAQLERRVPGHRRPGARRLRSRDGLVTRPPRPRLTSSEDELRLGAC